MKDGDFLEIVTCSVIIMILVCILIPFIFTFTLLIKSRYCSELVCQLEQSSVLCPAEISTDARESAVAAAASELAVLLAEHDFANSFILELGHEKLVAIISTRKYLILYWNSQFTGNY